jgi:Mn2+/Fe2+ NRAMP family transporter
LEPPTTFWGILVRLGPGLILVGNIVGSGELINTPALSAEAGYTFLWLILFSCFIKVFFQIEIGRYAISTGRTTLESINDLPGPRVLGLHGILWYWICMVLASFVQMGAMCGGVAQALRIAYPIAGGYSDSVWAVFTGLSIVLLLRGGRYRMIETVSVILVTGFTFVTIFSVAQIQFTQYAVRPQNIVDGFRFMVPEGSDPRRVIGLALSAFGITGVGASELIMYPYWCLEKGYSRFIGPRSDDPGWAQRARGWVRVMCYDAWLCMVLFTVATVAFYVLGAALLYEDYRRTGTLPKGAAMVEQLSLMYSATFGDYARYVFLVGAFCVLYSTFFIASAANARMLTDWLGLIGVYDRRDDEKRRLGIAAFSIVIPVVATSMYLVLREPVAMVMLSGVMQALMLPMIGYAVLYFAYRRTDPRIRARRSWYAMLWISFVLMSLASIYMAVINLLPRH